MSFVGLGATLNVAKPKKGSTVAIFGLGAVGLAVSLSSLAQQYQFLDFGLKLFWCTSFWNSLLLVLMRRLLLLFYMIRLLKGLELLVLQGLLGLI